MNREVEPAKLRPIYHLGFLSIACLFFSLQVARALFAIAAPEPLKGPAVVLEQGTAVLPSGCSQGYFMALEEHVVATCVDRDSYMTVARQNQARDEYINTVGYNTTTTKFRNLNIQDGKGSAIATFVGESKAAHFSGDVSIEGSLFINGKEIK